MAAIAITVFRDIGALSSQDIHPPCVMLGPRSEWRLNALQRKCGDVALRVCATHADTSCRVTRSLPSAFDAHSGMPFPDARAKLIESLMILLEKD